MFTEEEFNNLVKTYMDTVFRLALNYVQCSHTADDITQNVFIKLFHSNKSFENEDHIRYWLIRVTINESKKILISPWRKTVPIEEYDEVTARIKTKIDDEIKRKQVGFFENVGRILFNLNSMI